MWHLWLLDALKTLFTSRPNYIDFNALRESDSHWPCDSHLVPWWRHTPRWNVNGCSEHSLLASISLYAYVLLLWQIRRKQKLRNSTRFLLLLMQSCNHREVMNINLQRQGKKMTVSGGAFTPPREQIRSPSFPGTWDTSRRNRCGLNASRYLAALLSLVRF